MGMGMGRERAIVVFSPNRPGRACSCVEDFDYNLDGNGGRYRDWVRVWGSGLLGKRVWKGVCCML